MRSTDNVTRKSTFKWALASAAFLAAAALAAPGHADSGLGDIGAATNQGVEGWYVGVGGSGTPSYPRRDYLAMMARYPDPSGFGQTSFDSDLGLIGPGAHLGYHFARGTFPAWVGRNVRLTFYFSYWQGQTSGSASNNNGDDGGAQIVTQSGVVGVGCTACITSQTTINERLRSDMDAFEFSLRLSADRRLAPALVLTPSIALVGGMSFEDYNYSAQFVRNAGGNLAVNHDLNTYRLGGRLGLALTWRPFGPNFRVIGAARGSLFWVRSKLNGRDCFFLAGATCPVPAGTVIPNVGFNTTGSDSGTAFGLRGTLIGAVSYTWGALTITAGGFFSYDSAVPGITNPAANPAGPAAAGTVVGGSQVSFKGGAYGGAFLLFSVALY